MTPLPHTDDPAVADHESVERHGGRNRVTAPNGVNLAVRRTTVCRSPRPETGTAVVGRYDVTGEQAVSGRIPSREAVAV